MSIPVSRRLTVAGIPTQDRTALRLSAQALPAWCLKGLEASTRAELSRFYSLLRPDLPLEQMGQLRRATFKLLQRHPTHPGMLYLHGVACIWAGALSEAEAALVRSNQCAQGLAAAHPELQWGFRDSNLTLALMAGLDGDAEGFVAKLSAAGASLTVEFGAETAAKHLQELTQRFASSFTSPIAQAPVVQDFLTRLRARPASVAAPVDDFESMPARVIQKGSSESEPEYWFRVHHNLLLGAGESLPGAKVTDALSLALDVLLTSTHPEERSAAGPTAPGLGAHAVSELETWGTALLNLVATSPVDVARWTGDAAVTPELFNRQSLAEAALLLGITLFPRFDVAELAWVEAVRSGKDRSAEGLNRASLVMRSALAERVASRAPQDRVQDLGTLLEQVHLKRE